MKKIVSDWIKVALDKEEWITEKWYVSEYNFVDEVRKGMRLPRKVTITDATLRDGEQMAGVVFTKEDKIEIARKLDELGVHRIEAGFPAVSQEDERALKAIVKEGLKAKVTALAVGIKEHIDIPGTRYDPNLGITGMDVMVTVERAGYHIDEKKHARGKIGSRHKVSPEESLDFIKSKFGIEVGVANE